MPRSFARKMAILGGASFITYLEDAYPGTIIYDGQAPDGATVQSAYNRDVAGAEDSALFPKADIVVNGGFDTDTDWTKQAGWTIGSGVASCDGSSNAMFATAETILSTSPVTSVWQVDFDITAITAGAIRVEIGAYAGGGVGGTSDRSAVGSYSEKVILNAQSINRPLWRSLALNGSVDNLAITELNPLNADAVGATPAQTFSPPQLPYGWGLTVDDLLDFYSPELNSVFDGNECGIIGFFESDWSALTNESLMTVRVDDAGNRIQIQKAGTANDVLMFRAGGGTNSSNVVTGVTKSRNMFSLTVSKSSGATGIIRTFLNQNQFGSDLENIGDWAGALSSTRCLIGAFSAGAQHLTGTASLWIIFPTRAPSPSEIADIAQRAGF